jgi:hypothetical protein
MLRDIGMEVLEASNCQEALEQVKHHRADQLAVEGLVSALGPQE